MMVTQKLGPALITGNTVVAKPAATMPMCALRLAELAADALKRITLELGGNDAAIILGDVDLGVEVAMKIDSGTVWVNKHLDLPFDVPFSGAKQSGIGREGGDEGLHAYTQGHIVNVAL